MRRRLLTIALLCALPVGCGGGGGDSGGGKDEGPEADHLYAVKGGGAPTMATLAALGERLTALGGGKAQASGDRVRIRLPDRLVPGLSAVTAPGRFEMYDWEASVVGDPDRPRPSPAAVSGANVVRGEQRGFFALRGRPALTNADIARVQAGRDPVTAMPAVLVDFTRPGAARFEALTRRLSGRGRRAAGNTAAAAERTFQRFAIVVDERVFSLPRVNPLQAPEGIAGDNGAQITGIGAAAARDLAAELAKGPLTQQLVQAP